MLYVSIIPATSKDGNLDSFLAPLIAEMLFLESTGLKVSCDDGHIRTLRAHLVIATGDVPGVAALCHHGSHMSKFGCQICIIPSTRLESTKSEQRREGHENGNAIVGYERYYPGSITLDPERQLVDFKSGDVVLTVEYGYFGISEDSILILFDRTIT